MYNDKELNIDALLQEFEETYKKVASFLEEKHVTASEVQDTVDEEINPLAAMFSNTDVDETVKTAADDAEDEEEQEEEQETSAEEGEEKEAYEYSEDEIPENYKVAFEIAYRAGYSRLSKVASSSLHNPYERQLVANVLAFYGAESPAVIVREAIGME